MTASDRSIDQSAGPLKLVQVSDCHLFQDPDSTLLGMNCNDSLDAVLKLVREQVGTPDYFLCTGDLVQDGSIEGYRALRDKLAAFNTPSYWICGNHDDHASMNAVLDESREHLANQCQELSVGNWHIIFLNTQVEGKIYGQLSEHELAVLASGLEMSREAGRHALICMHHNPVNVGAVWLQRHNLRDTDDLYAVLNGFDHVKGILHGHIHQEQHVVRQGIPVWSVPSTCVQFHPDNDEFTLDTKLPGYRWLRLYPDGSIDTGVERLKEFDFDVDFDSAGY